MVGRLTMLAWLCVVAALHVSVAVQNPMRLSAEKELEMEIMKALVREYGEIIDEVKEWREDLRSQKDYFRHRLRHDYREIERLNETLSQVCGLSRQLTWNSCRDMMRNACISVITASSRDYQRLSHHLDEVFSSTEPAEGFNLFLVKQQDLDIMQAFVENNRKAVLVYNISDVLRLIRKMNKRIEEELAGIIIQIKSIRGDEFIVNATYCKNGTNVCEIHRLLRKYLEEEAERKSTKLPSCSINSSPSTLRSSHQRWLSLLERRRSPPKHERQPSLSHCNHHSVLLGKYPDQATRINAAMVKVCLRDTSAINRCSSTLEDTCSQYSSNRRTVYQMLDDFTNTVCSDARKKAMAALNKYSWVIRPDPRVPIVTVSSVTDTTQASGRILTTVNLTVNGNPRTWTFTALPYRNITCVLMQRIVNELRR